MELKIQEKGKKIRKNHRNNFIKTGQKMKKCQKRTGKSKKMAKMKIHT